MGGARSSRAIAAALSQHHSHQTSHGPPGAREGREAAGTGGRRAPACAPPFARDAVARSAPVTAAIAKATDGRSLIERASYRSGPPQHHLRSPLQPSPAHARERESLVSRRRPPDRPGARGQSPRLLAEAAQPLRLRRWRCGAALTKPATTTFEKRRARGSTSARARRRTCARCGSEERPPRPPRSRRRRMGGARSSAPAIAAAPPTPLFAVLSQPPFPLTRERDVSRSEDCARAEPPRRRRPPTVPAHGPPCARGGQSLACSPTRCAAASAA